MTPNPFRPTLLKLSGEILGSTHSTLTPEALHHHAQEIANAVLHGHPLAIVVGGGNLWRGTQGVGLGIPQASSDRMGMLATLMNGIALHHALNELGAKPLLLSQLGTTALCDPYTPWHAKQALQEGGIPIIGGGIGKPFVTTDTAASHVALELGCQLLLKGTKVDGIYEQDPQQHPASPRYAQLTLQEALLKGVKVMDATALALCQAHRLPIVVYNATQQGALQQVLAGKKDIGTRVMP